MPLTPVANAEMIAIPSSPPDPPSSVKVPTETKPELVNRSPASSNVVQATAKAQAVSTPPSAKSTNIVEPGSVVLPIVVAACLVAFLLMGVLVGLRIRKRRLKRPRSPKKDELPQPTPYVEKIIPKEVCSEEYPDLEPVEQGWHVHRKSHKKQQSPESQVPGYNGGGGGRQDEPWTPPFAPMDILMLPPFGSRATTPLTCDEGEEGKFLECSSKSNSGRYAASPTTPLSPGSDEMTLPPPLSDKIIIQYDEQQQQQLQQEEEEEEEPMAPVNRSKHRFSRRRRSHRTQYSPAESPQPSPGLPAEGQDPVVETELLKRRERRRMRRSRRQPEHLMVPQRYAKQETTDLARRRLAMACMSNDDSDSNSDALIR